MLEIWREGGAPLLRDHLQNERAAARRQMRYVQWMRDVEPRLFAEWMEDARLPPGGVRFSVVVPVHDTDPAMLRCCLRSVQAQTYPEWELLIVDDASTRSETTEVLGEFVASEPRARIIQRSEQGGIAAATNDGLAAAGGDYVALLDHDDELSPHALRSVARHIDSNAEVDVLYSDEDKLDGSGQRNTPVFKPGLSPHHLFTSNYCCHFLVVRTSLLRELDGLASSYDGAQDYDLVLRCLERTTRFSHIPLVLYHWRSHAASTSGAGGAKPHAAEAGRRALAASMQRRGLDCAVHHSPYLLSYRVVPALTTDDQVEVIRIRAGRGSNAPEWPGSVADGASKWVLVLSEALPDLDATHVGSLVAAAKLPHAGPVSPVLVSRQGRIADAGWMADGRGAVCGRYLGCERSHPGAGWALRLPRNVSCVGPHCMLAERRWLQQAIADAKRTQPWYVNVAIAARREGRYAQVLGDLFLQTGRLDVQPAGREKALESDGLYNANLAWVEPEYARWSGATAGGAMNSADVEEAG